MTNNTNAAQAMTRERFEREMLYRYHARYLAKIGNQYADAHIESEWQRFAAQPPQAQAAEAVAESRSEPSVAETALSDAYYFVTGKSPAWSESFTRGDAVEEIKQSVNLLRRRAMPDDIADVLTRLEKLVTWEPTSLSHEAAVQRLESINTLLYNVLTGKEEDPLRWPHAITAADVRSLIADHRRDGIRQVRGFGLTASGGYLIRVADTLQWCLEQIDATMPASPVASNNEREGLTDAQYVNAAQSAGLLAELCIFSEYDPDVGRVPGHWKPRFMHFANILLAARTGEGA